MLIRQKPSAWTFELEARREPDVPGDLLRALVGNVTEPMGQGPGLNGIVDASSD
jgi:hypothetical protein